MVSLTYIEEGSSDLPRDVVSVKKLYLAYNIITEAKMWWDTPYPFERNPALLSWLYNIETSPGMSETQLYNQSLIVEPRR